MKMMIIKVNVLVGKLGMLFAILASLAFTTAAAQIIGVEPSRQHEYQVADLKCPSTGIKLTQEMINDGHCDCPDDGFDEPGTAACAKGKFYCANAPLKPIYISSFKVNDGVCDCCDGSDEYLNNFGTPCPNTCSDFIKAARRAKYIQKAHYKKALKVAEDMKIKSAARKQELSQQLGDINNKLDDIKKQTESVSNDIRENPQAFEEFISEYKAKIKQLEDLVQLINNDRQKAEETVAEVDSEEPIETSNPSWSHLLGEKISRVKAIVNGLKSTKKLVTTITHYIPVIVTKTIVKFEPSVSHERLLYELDYERSELEGQAEVLKTGLSSENYFGPNSIYLVLKDECFSYDVSQYTYRLCLFNDVTQTEQYTRNVLGYWKGWYQFENGTYDYHRMLYSDGYRCGDISREATVQLKCGLNNEIKSVSEPSPCKYHFSFETPGACTY